MIVKVMRRGGSAGEGRWLRPTPIFVFGGLILTWQKLSLALALLTVGAVASAQMPMPPPDFEGASYWYGPGPRQTVSLDSSHQTNGAWMDFSSMSSGGASDPLTFDAATGRSRGHVTLIKRVDVQPYCYVDGYFGSDSSVSGWSSSSSSLSVGACRFYVVHNCPVLVSLSGFSRFVSSTDSDGDGVLDECPAVWTITCRAYRPGRPVFGNFTVDGAPQGQTSQTVDVPCPLSVTGGMCEFTCDTSLSPPASSSTLSSGIYKGTCDILISL